ncbi:hypothetical protein ACCAA_560026 [Candidatus Accumulibacter aalborgensis]|uniref:Uncharacterized protein n=1 Tax=Candidatus Accumulibacter aalborgensis TaxID=1860102 RepID=A0A1A8XWE4_9PROT|nr:hypothetical protein ACCAA_560026 [Candidatus Accumulibacter aalborgensis]
MMPADSAFSGRSAMTVSPGLQNGEMKSEECFLRAEVYGSTEG